MRYDYNKLWLATSIAWVLILVGATLFTIFA